MREPLCVTLLFFGLAYWTTSINGWSRSPAFFIGIFLLYGGGPYIGHYALRAILFFYGYAPFFYVKFLNEMANQRILQRVGGSYRFLHHLLLEHMADEKWMKLELDTRD